MMSLPPEEEVRKKVPGWRQPWDTWRILMVAGSLVLLGLGFSNAGGDARLPEWLVVALYVIGYGLLAYGFFLAMRIRREIRTRRIERERNPNGEKVSPRDPG